MIILGGNFWIGFVTGIAVLVVIATIYGAGKNGNKRR